MKEDISNRNTISRRIPELNSLYAYHTRSKAKFTRRLQEGEGYRYTIKKAIFYAAESQIYIYHRTVEIRGVKKGLTLVTMDSEFKKVRSWFNEQIIAIEQNDELFTRFAAAKSRPQELGLLYLH